MRFSKMLSVLFFLAAGTAFSWAHGGATGIVKERMDAMTDIGQNIKLIGLMLQGQKKFDDEEARDAADAIAAHSGEALTELFPNDSLHKPSEASSAIWTDWDRFQQLADELQSSASMFAERVRAGEDPSEIQTTFAAMSRTCKECHQAFRIKK